MNLSVEPDPVAPGKPFTLTMNFINHSSIATINGVEVRLAILGDTNPPAAWGCEGESTTWDICTVPVQLPPGGSSSVQVSDAAVELGAGSTVPLPPGPARVHVEALTQTSSGQWVFANAYGSFTVS